MALSVTRTMEYVLNNWPDDIQKSVGGDESQTVKLVRLIVESVINEVSNNGEVIIINLPVQTAMSIGTANGKADII